MIKHNNEINNNFIEKMVSIMINFVSSDEYVNELIYALYQKSLGRKANINKEFKNKKPNYITDVDMFLYGYSIILYEYNTSNDDYMMIIRELYYRLNDIVYNEIHKEKDKEMICVRVWIKYSCSFFIERSDALCWNYSNNYVAFFIYKFDLE